MSFIDAHNGKPKPCKWVKSADEILASVSRFCLKANQLGVNEEVGCELEIQETRLYRSNVVGGESFNMSMTPEDAWCEEAYDQMVKEILESQHDEIIDEFVSDRMASYYRNNPNLAAAAQSALSEARSLLSSSPNASLVFSRSATEIALRDVLLKPIAHGMVHNEHSGALMVEFAIRNQHVKKLLFAVLEEYGIDLKSISRKGTCNNLWEEIQEMANTRNKILHRGEMKASAEQAERSLEIAIKLLDEIYPYLRKQVLVT